MNVCWMWRTSGNLPSALGLAGVLLVLAQATCASPLILDWSAVTFTRNDSSLTGADTYVGNPADLGDPYLGLASSSGGVTGFQSQTFADIDGSDIDVTMYYSNNNYDGAALEGPDLYDPSTTDTAKPDSRVTGPYALRTCRDSVGSLTPVSIVLSFSEPVYIAELVLGSLSEVGTSNENAIVRAFGTNDATGSVTAATYFENISDLSDGSSLVNGLWDQDPNAPVTTNALSNVSVDPDHLTLDEGGVATNVGGVGDDGIYHIIGVGNQAQDRYGRVALAWDETGLPVQSIAVSYWASDNVNFDTYETTTQWISSIIVPVSFTPVPEPGGMVLSALACTGLLLRRRKRRGSRTL